MVRTGTGFDSRTDLLINGLLVQRQDTWPATRRSGFKSSAVHYNAMGPWSNGKTPVRQTGNPGSIPGGSTETEWKVAGYGSPGRFAKPCDST